MFVSCNIKRRFIFLSFLFTLQKCKSSYCVIIIQPILPCLHVSTHVNTEWHIHTTRVAIFLLSMRTVVEEPITCKIKALKSKFIYSKYTIPLSARSNYLSKQNQCALTYANKLSPGGSLNCHLSIMYCVIDLCYINKMSDV